MDFIWPPHSLLSDYIIEKDGTMEMEYWKQLNFHFGPQCKICGIPMTDAHGHEDLCPACIQSPPIFEMARAPILYDENSKPLVLALKHHGRKDGIKTFANLMKECIIWDDIDLIIPVPLHRLRLLERGFNQSAWLCEQLSKLTQKPWDYRPLTRTKNTKTQNHLSTKGRERNVASAFIALPAVKGKNICLVDDVFTTGSTVSSCAKALKKAGAKSIVVLTFLRVGRPKSLEDFEMELLNDTI